MRKAIVIGAHPQSNVGGWTKRIVESDRLGWTVDAPKLDVTLDVQMIQYDWKADALVYSAGFCEPDWIWDTTVDRLRYQVEVNLLGALTAVSLFIRHNTSRRSDSLLSVPGPPRRIVLVGSAAADTPHRGQVAYNAAKAGLRAVVSTLAREIHGRGFRIFLVEPGAIDGTDYSARVADGARRMGLADRAGATRGTFGRNLDPEEVGDFIALLVSGRYDRLAGLPIPYSGGPQ